MEQKKEGDISYRKGKEAYVNHAYEEAAEYLEEAARLSPDKFAYFYLGESLGKLKKHDKALEALTQAYNYLPKDKETREHVIVLQCQAIQARLAENFDLARKYNQTAWEVGNRIFKGGDLEGLKAEVETETQDIKRAEAQQATKHIEAMVKSGEEFEKRKAYTEAIEQYEKVLKEKELPSVYVRRGKCLYLAQRFKEAIADFDKFKELVKDGTDHEPAYYKSMCLAELEDFEAALKEFHELYDKIKEDRRSQNLLREVVQHYNSIKERMRIKETVKVKSPASDSRKRDEIVAEGKLIREAFKNEKLLDVFFA